MDGMREPYEFARIKMHLPRSGYPRKLRSFVYLNKDSEQWNICSAKNPISAFIGMGRRSF